MTTRFWLANVDFWSILGRIYVRGSRNIATFKFDICHVKLTVITYLLHLNIILRLICSLKHMFVDFVSKCLH